MNVGVIDILFFVIILAIAVRETIKGFIEGMLGKLAVILGIAGAVFFYKRITEYIIKYVNQPVLASVLSFLLVFVVIYLTISIIKLFLGKLFEGAVLGGLDKSLGFFLGIVEGLIVVAVIMIIMELQPWFDVSNLMEKSLFYGLLKQFIVVPEQYITENINIAIMQKSLFEISNPLDLSIWCS